ncbi:MAG: peptidase, partial [Thaumarchaeota archaeon]|nr:peptidase [Nitrososphaerota archaeon]
RNNANWWALDKISEEEFVNGIKYLIQQGIITV